MLEKEIITPFAAPDDLQIEIVNTEAEAISFMNKGFTPVECSFGSVSVVDKFIMDHHGQYADLEGVAIRAYRDFFGAARNNPKFVVTGFPDEDATFAICALAGIIPHPSFATKLSSPSKDMLIVAQMDLMSVATLINDVDVNPDLALELVDTYRGRIVLSWRQQGHKNCRDKLAWYGGVDRWRTILTAQSRDFIDASLDSHVASIEQALKVKIEEISPNIVVADFSDLGPNSTYYRVWLNKYPILVAYMGNSYHRGRCSFAVTSIGKAKELLGENGLIEVYHKLFPSDCGGREIIGGSSRTRSITWEEACDYGRQINACIKA